MGRTGLTLFPLSPYSSSSLVDKKQSLPNPPPSLFSLSFPLLKVHICENLPFSSFSLGYHVTPLRPIGTLSLHSSSLEVKVSENSKWISKNESKTTEKTSEQQEEVEEQVLRGNGGRE